MNSVKTESPSDCFEILKTFLNHGSKYPTFSLEGVDIARA